MSAVYNPKTLAKTLSTILYHSPGEYGLFWDSDGTMPWKELYWALQEDPSLRFVRESHLKEITYLDIEFPAVLDGKLCRLKEGFPPPHYAPAPDPPRRLFHGCPRRRLPIVRDHGLRPTSRPFLRLFGEREMALRLARRRDADCLIVEVRTETASAEGVAVLAAGGPLYLSSAIPPSSLVLPLVREQDVSRTTDGKKEKSTPKATRPASPGSFLVSPAHLQETVLPGRDGGSKTGKKRQRGPEWKRESRKERGKRDI
jgi:putative RNA 2'-phosphotransferase